jgi:hypothetical protein
MHVPKPLGGYPLVLRSNTASKPRNNELMLDYTTNDLYFVENGVPIKLARSIYDKIIKSKLENVTVNICKSDKEGSEPTAPAVASRKMNNWYMNIQSRSSEDV